MPWLTTGYLVGAYIGRGDGQDDASNNVPVNRARDYTPGRQAQATNLLTNCTSQRHTSLERFQKAAPVTQQLVRQPFNQPLPMRTSESMPKRRTHHHCDCLSALSLQNQPNNIHPEKRCTSRTKAQDGKEGLLISPRSQVSQGRSQCSVHACDPVTNHSATHKISNASCHENQNDGSNHEMYPRFRIPQSKCGNQSLHGTQRGQHQGMDADKLPQDVLLIEHRQHCIQPWDVRDSHPWHAFATECGKHGSNQ
mmetsp:Transcript_16672/g.38307  ORF Transcript_16672/g.38307 Transcript_16672/m.38307 type:complete len:252 (-) Transcript_16672:91-846(-)